MAYTFGNKCAKNCCKWTILVQLIVEDVVTYFSDSVEIRSVESGYQSCCRNSAEKTAFLC